MEQSGWHKQTVRVRYQETDQMGVVYHANYLTWFEMGRTEWIRETTGITYRDLEARGLLLPVVEAEIKFLRPALYDDTVAVYTKVTGFSSVRLSFSYEIRRIGPEEPGETCSGAFRENEEILLVTGATHHAWTDRSFKPLRLDKKAPDIYRLLSGKGGE